MQNFEKQIVNDVIVEVVKPRNITIKEALEFKNILAEDMLLADGDIIVDLSECDNIDSSFIGVLVIALKDLRWKGKDLLLIEPLSGRTRAIFSVMDTYKVFKIFHSMEDALNHINNKNTSNKNAFNNSDSTEMKLAERNR